MAKEKKAFRPGLYAVIVSIVLAVVLGIMAYSAFVSRYNGYSAKKIARNYVDTIVQTGDGYNAYKNTLVSQNKDLKYGDFIRRGYMAPFVNDGEDVKQAEFVGTGTEEEQKAIDEVYSQMYDYYVELLNTYGWDDYDSMYCNYFSKLREVRRAVYGDDYMDTEYMFGALEANVAAYGQSLTGTELKYASDNKTVIQEETEGSYQIMFGKLTDVEVEKYEDGKKVTVTEQKLRYRLITEATSCTEFSEDEVKAYAEGFRNRINETINKANARSASEYTLSEEQSEEMNDAFAKLDCADSITGVALVSVAVLLEDGTPVAVQNVYVVSIDGVWYVDNTNIDTSVLYLSQGE